ncbi:MAG: NAD(P)-dependent oxidoreductase [Gammaproteobacteria bacterium]|jgi:3-hydroxyisobutyrate dehydrogenase-like beta-hydroxyacid dehydrogenase
MNNNDTAVFGLGIMGRAIADNLAEDGLLTASWNRSPQADAPKVCASIEEALSKAKVLLIVVVDGPAVSEVIDQMKPFLSDDHIVVQCATVKPDENLDFKNRVEECGASFIEALIGGSKIPVVNRTAALYLGGCNDVIARVEPVLERISGKRIHVGEVGKASVAKLAINLNLAMQVEALCESYAYAISNGLNDDEYFEVLRNNTSWNALAEFKEPKFRDRNYEPQFSVKNMLKDVRLALETEKTDKGMTLLKKTEAIYTACEQSGLGEEDMIALYKMLHH